MNDERIPVISMWAPWILWVFLGWKTIETRDHNKFARLLGKTIILHAARRYDKDAIALAERYDKRVHHTLDYAKLWCYPRGLVGSVFVKAIRPLSAADSNAALIDCSSLKKYGLILENPQLFPVPFPIKGRQGIFYVRKAGNVYVEVLNTVSAKNANR